MLAYSNLADMRKRIEGLMPIGVFEIGSTTVPSDWHFRLVDGLLAAGAYDGDDRCAFLMGYEELMDSRSHREGLLEGAHGAIEIFYRELTKYPYANT